jgi:ribonuclease Z
MNFNNYMYGIWNAVPSFKLPGTSITLTGYSICAKKTNFYIPELQIMLDAGLPSKSVPDHIFITHGHIDHCYNLPMALVDLGDKRPIIYVPKLIIKETKDFIHSAYVLTTLSQTPRIHNKYTLIGVENNSQLNVVIRNKSWKVDIIKCYHGVPCVGYGFSEIRKKLKDEYKNIDGKKLGQFKKDGINISYDTQLHHFCYIGDTDFRILTNPILYKFNTIIIECSFLLNDHYELAQKKKHMHWVNIEPYIKSHQSILFILYHFSARYTPDEIKDFIKKTELTNIHPWI